MAQLFLADVHSSTGKSTETIYEIKAPLASFDTIDLDDDILSVGSLHSEVAADLPEKGIKESVESESQESSFDLSEGRSTPVCITCSKDEVIQPYMKHAVFKKERDVVETKVTKDSDSSNTLNSDAEKTNDRHSQQNGDMIEKNSSENNASAEEIKHKLKVKGRKRKEKSTNVKYEKMDSSDISDQEKSSPMPTFKFKMDQGKVYSTDSDSSDSDNGYIQGGFIATTKGATANRQIKPGPHHYIQNRFGIDSVDSDSTPHSSPKMTRPTLPPPLSKEDAEKMSKKKAYEKRLQRMQITTNPIERPRSTTPINIFGLDEYASIGSPERSVSASNLEKLKITLPAEETYRSPKRTPRSSSQKSGDGGDAFNFSEDFLFTHTRSAFLVEDGGSRGASPKRILVPPTLSPKLSPARSPLPSRSGSCSPRYYYSPSTQKQGHSRGGSLDITADFLINQNWANFDGFSNTADSKDQASIDSKYATGIGDSKTGDENVVKVAFADTNTNNVSDRKESKTDEFCNDVADFDFAKERENEEVLTVKIERQGDVNTCDITCDVVKKSSSEVENSNTGNIVNTEENSLEVSENNKEEPGYIDLIKDKGESQHTGDCNMTLENSAC